jgi:hypothetical protein
MYVTFMENSPDNDIYIFLSKIIQYRNQALNMRTQTSHYWALFEYILYREECPKVFSQIFAKNNQKKHV